MFNQVPAESSVKHHLAVAIAALALFAPAMAQEPAEAVSPSELFGSSQWQVERVVLAGEPFALSAEVTTELTLVTELPALAGTAGCNRMTARFELGPAPGQIDFSPIVATLMACPEPAMSQERAVFEALEGVETYEQQGGLVVLRGPDVELVLAPLSPEGLEATPPRQTELDAFNRAVASATAAGARWPHDPVRVALAFVELSGATETSIVASYGAPDAAAAVEGPRDVAIVTIEERGVLDDSVSAVTQRVSLEFGDGHWLVTGHEIVWHCARGPEAERVEPLRCP